MKLSDQDIIECILVQAKQVFVTGPHTIMIPGEPEPAIIQFTSNGGLICGEFPADVIARHKKLKEALQLQ